MRVLIAFLILLISTPAFAKPETWTSYGRQTLMEGLTPMHVMKTRSKIASLSLFMWDTDGSLRLLMPYNNGTRPALTPESITVFIQPKDDAKTGAPQSKLALTGVIDIVADPRPDSNISYIVVLLSPADFQAVGSSHQISVNIARPEKNEMTFSFTTEDFERAWYFMQMEMEDEAEERAYQADIVEHDQKFEVIKKKVSAYRHPDPKCGRPVKIDHDASNYAINQANADNEAWGYCMMDAVDDDLEHFKTFVKDIGGKITMLDDGGFKFSAPRDFWSVQETLLALYDDIVKRHASRKETRSEFDDYVDRINANREARDTRQARRNQKDEFWNSLSSALDKGQRDIDQMNAQRQQYLNNQIYVTPGYK